VTTHNLQQHTREREREGKREPQGAWSHYSRLTMYCRLLKSEGAQMGSVEFGVALCEAAANNDTAA